MPSDADPEVISVYVVDPAPLARICVVAGLESDPGLVPGGYGSLDEMGDADPPDVLLLHGGSGEDGGWLAENLRRAAFEHPDATLMVLVDEVTPAGIDACQSDGVSAALTSATSIDALTRSIRLAHEGIKVFSPALLARRGAGIAGARGIDGVRTSAEVAGPRRTLSLTPRQEEVVRLLASGCSNREIANRLRVSESTVKVHVRTLMSGIGASNRTQIVAHLLTGGFPHAPAKDGTP